MILLDSTVRRLRIFLGGAGAIPWSLAYAVLDPVTMALTSEAAVTGATNGATVVDLVAFPATGTWRKLLWLQVRNSSGGAVVVTLRYDDNATARDFASFALDDGDMIQYAHGEGFRVFDSTGALKGAGGGASSLTVEEVDGAPTLTATKIKFAQADGLTVTDEGGGVARVNFGGSVSASNSRRVPWMLGG